MTDFLDGAYKDIKNRMRSLLSDPFFQNEIIPDKETSRLRVLNQVKALARQGVSA